MSFDLSMDSFEENFETGSGRVELTVGTQAAVDFMGESTEGNLHLVDDPTRAGVVNVFGLHSLEDIINVPVTKLAAATQKVLDILSVPDSYPAGDPERAIYCSRTLNLRSIKAIGYDMDYTLIHYSVEAWEGRAYEYGLDSLREQGLPVEGLKFDADLVIRGLIMDKELGNLIKVDRFGLVKRAMHGTRMLSWSEIRELYGREVVNLRNEGRWVFLNTLFSVSEAVMYMQLVDRLDEGKFVSSGSAVSYQQLYGLVAKALYRTHVEGKLKSEIIQVFDPLDPDDTPQLPKPPEKYVELDPEMAQTLMDQRDSGKQLLLITNSDYQYTARMMSYAYDRFLPAGMTWRNLFDMVIVQARKPDFFNYNMSLYEVVTDDGLMRPVLAATKGGLFAGGSARMVEKALGVEGDDILYVGDHIYTDAALAKINFRWRTALIIRELEKEVEAMAIGKPHRLQLKELMLKKELVGDTFNQLRLARQRFVNGHSNDASFDDEESLNETLAQLLMVMEHLDDRIGPMLEQDGAHFNRRWGFLSRAGVNDKSQLSRQIEKYADIYTSRVSNFQRYTPYSYFSTSTAPLDQQQRPLMRGKLHLPPPRHTMQKNPKARLTTTGDSSRSHQTPPHTLPAKPASVLFACATRRSPSQSVAHDRNISQDIKFRQSHHETDSSSGPKTSTQGPNSTMSNSILPSLRSITHAVSEILSPASPASWQQQLQQQVHLSSTTMPSQAPSTTPQRSNSQQQQQQGDSQNGSGGGSSSSGTTSGGAGEGVSGVGSNVGTHAAAALFSSNGPTSRYLVSTDADEDAELATLVPVTLSKRARGNASGAAAAPGEQ
ncbi:MAG: hypothetical protein WDW36_003832 [Sanguina aurantia]